MRHYSSSVGVKVLYGLLALTFVAWGAGTMGLNRMNVVAEVRGQRITSADVEREADLLRQRFTQLTQGAQVPEGMDFRDQALESLITDALINYEATRLGLGVSDDELVATITEMPELQRNGQFDRERLERFLEFQRDKGEFEAEVRHRILADRLRGLVVDGLEVSDAEVHQEYDLQYAKITLDFVREIASKVGAALPVTDDDLNAYVTANRQRYLGPAKVRIRYVVFSADDYAAAAAPSASEIQAYYDQHLANDFTKPEQVHARHLLVRVASDASDEERAAARKRIEGLRAEIAAGADFATVAKEHSDDRGSGAQGGDLGWFPRGKMDPAFEKAAFALEPGTLSDVVETPFGFHLILVEAHDPGGPQPLPEVRDTIVKAIVHQRGLELARNDADAVRRAIVDGKSLAEAAGKHPVLESDPFPKGTFVPGIGAAPDINGAAFALGEGEVSDLIEGPNGVYIVSPFGRTPPALPPLDEIRTRVEADYRRDKGAEVAKEKAEKVLARAREVGLAAAAKEAGLEVHHAGPFSRRDGSIPELGSIPTLQAALASLDTEHPLAPSVYVAGRDAVVVALADREPADEAGFAAERKTLAEAMLRRRRTEAFDRYVDLLKQRAQADGALTVHTDALG
jgi:peptidyl-prolyl cis-trans isomerase D